MLKKLEIRPIVAANADDVRAADKIILPGVGSFDARIKNLRATGLLPALEKRVLGDGIPILGVCLGMQLLTQGSEEGEEKGLGWVQAKAIRFRFPPEDRRPVPHMGWNEVSPRKSHSLINGLPADSRFYFVHSYHVACETRADTLLECDYGGTFTAAFAHANIIGVQFHPEKSHKFGMSLLRNYAGVAEKKKVVSTVF